MSHESKRLVPQPAQQINHAARIAFHYNGRIIPALEGDTVASALFAHGERIFSRSFKYHRPRGLLCCSGDCPNCIMEVDRRPNVRACRTVVQDGMQVVSQHAWPTVKFDFLRVIERLDFLLPIGFYYKILYKPRLAWKIAEPIIRRLAGLGRVRGEDHFQNEYEHRSEYVDVLVVGAGPAGIEAAMHAAAAGASVLLVDNEPNPGGHLRYETRLQVYGGNYRPSSEIAEAMKGALSRQGKVRILCDATAFGSYEGGLVPILKGNTLIHVRCKALVVATGCHQYPAVFENNDLPGVMLSRAALRLINLFGISPGRTAVIVTGDDEGYFAAIECLRAGVGVAAVVDSRPFRKQPGQSIELRANGVQILNNARIQRAVGRSQVSAAIIAAADEAGKLSKHKIECDLLLLSTGWQANASLLLQSGGKLELDQKIGHQIPSKTAPGTFAAGEMLGIRDLPGILDSARRAAVAAVQHIKGEESSWSSELNEMVAYARNKSTVVEGAKFTGQNKNFVCLCEDVVEKDLRRGVEEGFDEVETLKRYSTVSMGPCQGRMCSRNSTEICGLATNRDFGAVGTTTNRPPIHPVPLGALAGPEFSPVKRTSIHHKHLAATQQIMNMGMWKRPFVYSSVNEEYDAVRHRAGLIDVSTLGKLLVKGKDAPILLDMVYTHKMSDLKPGRIRYGVICDESGIIVDDGTVACLASDNYYISTSTGNIDLIEQWMKWSVAGTSWRVHVLNITSGMAAVNLAGPSSRAILATLTEVDISSTAFPYMSCRQGTVAGVPATLLRVGFVGELGWEIHFPAEYGQYLWETILEAGASKGIRPFGVETQRLLRLEKKHIIVNQDTDALSNPFDCGMEWVVRLDKPDFIGRHALAKLKRGPSQNRLVGIHATGDAQPVDGTAIVIQGKLAGRITSVRFSPHLKKYIGLAWVPAEFAFTGSTVGYHVEGKVYPAEVVEGAFYDDEGVRSK